MNQSTLSKEQQKVLQIAIRGFNVFITGSAGVGKSFLLREVISQLKRQGKQVVVTASTGIAALNIQGRTIHSFSGIQLRPNGQIDKVSAWKKKNQWRSTDVLVIDEISMLDADFFDALESVATEIRCYQQIRKRIPKDQLPPFGGIQLILCGDFLQLPPVDTSSNHSTKKMCFTAASWGRCVRYSFELKQVFRQEQAEFVSILNEIRYGNMSPETNQRVYALSRPLRNIPGGIEPTYIYARNALVDQQNYNELRKLSSEEVVLTAHTDYYNDSVKLKTIDANFVEYKMMRKGIEQSNVQQTLRLKIGAQVMLIRNHPNGTLVNGSRGVVTGFVTTSEHFKNAPPNNYTDWLKFNHHLPVVRFDNIREAVIEPITFETFGTTENYCAKTCQVPLKLAWAISIHKTQGLSLDYCIISMREIFEKGQAYVALSRCRSLDGIQVLNFDPKKVRADETALQFYRNLAQYELGYEEIDLLALSRRSYPQNNKSRSDNHIERNSVKKSFHHVSEDSDWNNEKQHQPKRSKLDEEIRTGVDRLSVEIPKNQSLDELTNAAFALMLGLILNNSHLK